MAKLGLWKDLGSLKSDANDFKPYLGLVVIGVDVQYQGYGYGSRLLKEFETRARKIPEVKRILLTVDKSNERAIQAYQANDWTMAGEGNDSLKLKKDL